MAKAKKREEPVEKPKRKRRWKLRLFLIFIVLILILNGWMLLQASVIHVRRATVRLEDLPDAFDGTTILYASDIDICGIFGANRAISAFESLKALEPDLLILGGDYVSPTLWERLNNQTADLQDAQPFFESLADFPAPLGKFAISGDNDDDPEILNVMLSACGIRLIDNQCAVIQKDASAIGIVGVGADSTSLNDLVSGLSNAQCAIAVAHSPSQFVDIRVNEASDGGAWADLMLAGHTHGGQVVLFGQAMLSLNPQERQYLSGWTENALVTTGFGCEGANLRFGTTSEVWLITLEKADAVRMHFD